MAFSKLYDSPAAAVADVGDGSTVLIGGVSHASEPTGLLAALAATDAGGLTCVCDFGDWDGASGVLELLQSGRVAKIVTPGLPRVAEDAAVHRQVQSGQLEVELVPQGTLAERLRAGGAGIGGVFVPVGIGTPYAQGRETRVINGVECALEPPLRADFALLRAHRADAVGNLVYDGPQRGWSAVMAGAARVAVAEVDEVGEPGSIDPELVITPGIFVNRIITTPATPKEG